MINLLFVCFWFPVRSLSNTWTLLCRFLYTEFLCIKFCCVQKTPCTYVKKSQTAAEESNSEEKANTDISNMELFIFINVSLPVVHSHKSLSSHCFYLYGHLNYLVIKPQTDSSQQDMSRDMTKTNKMSVRPAKNKISLGNRPV